MLSRILINGAILAVLTWAGINSAQAGLGRLFSEYSATSNSLSASERALDFNPYDAEAHYLRGLQLTVPAEAISELERATVLRPADYFLWQELARVREDNGDLKGAIQALQTATSLAPYYAQPHWQLGNALLRAEQTEAGFNELRTAANSDSELFPTLMDLAYGLSDGEPHAITKALAVKNDHERSLLIDFFLKHDCREAAVQLVGATRNLSSDERELLVSSLIAAGEFSLAYSLWLNGKTTVDGIYDGDFENAISGNETGFGWQPTKLSQTVQLLLDIDQRDSGNRSLRINYAGNFDEETPVISQLVPVETNTHYRVSFSSRSDSLFSAGLPVVSVISATGEHKNFGTSSILSSGTSGWTATSFEFQTQATTKAVNLILHRTPCNLRPCPITGKLWLDSFSLEKLN